MPGRISRIIDSGVSVVDAYARLNIARLQSLVLGAAAWAVAALIAFVACGILLAAAGVALAEVLGPSAALAIVGGALLLLAILVGVTAMGIASFRERTRERDLELRAKELQKEFSAACDFSPDEERARSGPGILAGLLSSRSPLEAASHLLRTTPPATLAAAGVGVAALFGPFRALRLLARAAAAIAALRAITDNLGDLVRTYKSATDSNATPKGAAAPAAAAAATHAPPPPSTGPGPAATSDGAPRQDDACPPIGRRF